MGEPVRYAQHNDAQDHHTERHVDADKRRIRPEPRHHDKPDEQHGKDQNRDQPVQDSRPQRIAPDGLGHGATLST
jgi:hypothetical protein